MTDPTVARLDWRGVTLHPLRDTDMVWLRQAELGSYLAFRWRHRGEHVTPHEFGAALWAATFVNFVVGRHATPNEAAGIVSAYDLDTSSLHCKVAAAAFTPAAQTATFRGLLLTLEYLFTGWPLRKIYFDVPSFNLRRLSGGVSKHLVQEGVLRDHIYLAGDMHDLHVFALYREAWVSWAESTAGWSREG